MSPRQAVSGRNYCLFYIMIGMATITLVVGAVLVFNVIPLRTHYNACVSFNSLGDFAQAIPECEAAIRQDLLALYPDTASLLAGARDQQKEQLYQQGLAEMGLGNWVAAEHAFRQLAELDAGYRDMQAQRQVVAEKMREAGIPIPEAGAAAPTPDLAATSSPALTSTVSPTSPLPPSCRWALRAFNASDPQDLNQIFVNGTPVIKQPNDEGIMQDTEWVDITNMLSPIEENVIRFVAYNAQENATWGFGIRRDDEQVVEERNGNTTTIPLRQIVFTRSFAISDCEFRPLEPTNNRWVVVIPKVDSSGAAIFIDGERGAAWSRDAVVSLDISKWILEGQTHKLNLQCSNSHARVGKVNYQVVKNEQIVFSKDYQGDGTYCNENVYILPDGKLSLEPPPEPTIP